MTTHRNNIQTPTVQSTLWSRKFQAFVVVALASFLLISLTWPLSVRTYVSQGQIEFDVIKTPIAIDAFQQQLAKIVQQNTSAESVAQLSAEAQAVIPGKAINLLSASGDFNSRFTVRLAKGSGEGRFDLNVAYSGKGTKAENYMVNLLTSNIARDFLASPNAKLGTGEILAPDGSTSDSSQAEDLVAQSHQLNQQAEQIFTRLASDANQGPRSKFAKTSATPFMSVSHTSGPAMSNGDEIAELKETVGQLSSLVRESVSHASSGNAVAFSVRSVSSQPPRPLGGSPKLPQILLITAIAGLIGTVISVAYRPFEETGFENIASVVHKLGVPVVATLGDASEDVATAKANSSAENWANRVVQFAELFLFAITIIAISFCVVNPEIRSAFADNLFHGFARIAWMFQR